MRSRILLGIGAWVLGAASATAGSLYAVDQLGQSLLAQHTKQISVAMVNAELAVENADRATQGASPPSSPSTSQSPATARARHRPAAVLPGKARRVVHRPSSKLLTSQGGTAAASCDNGLARLLYWSPAQGFEAGDVNKGPGRVASVSFTDSSGGVVMRIACTSAGVPFAHVSPVGWGGSHHDE
ncbi:MAG TPA: hypothetical protein VFW16_03780 [Streptosporangiaceae bacterium]|nr:hypothetical protein [Streptosporangiaceae bacterium]